MKKINKHFYLNKEAIEKLEIIKQEKRLDKVRIIV